MIRIEAEPPQPEVYGGGCECWVTPEREWFRYGSAVEPGSQVEWNPDCPKHGSATDAHAKLTAALDLLADVSYHEASLPPRVQRAVRAAHRAVAKAAQRAGGGDYQCARRAA